MLLGLGKGVQMKSHDERGKTQNCLPLSNFCPMEAGCDPEQQGNKGCRTGGKMYTLGEKG